MLRCHMKGQDFPSSFKLKEMGDPGVPDLSQPTHSLTTLFISQAAVLHPAEGVKPGPPAQYGLRSQDPITLALAQVATAPHQHMHPRPPPHTHTASLNTCMD